MLAERDVEAMSAELKAVMAGTDPRAAARGGIDEPSDRELRQAGALRDEIDSLGRRARTRDREADAARRLDELKRRMGK